MTETRQSSDAEEQWRRWMTAAQEGDEEAYESLLKAILPLLRTVTARRLEDLSSVEDVVQTVLLSIHRHRHTYDPARLFGPWLRAIARNAATDALRTRTRRMRREVVLGEPDQVMAPGAPDNDLSLSPALSDALDALPARQREAVELLHIEQLSVIEAAERAGTSPGALKVRAHRGYTALRKLLRGPRR